MRRLFLVGPIAFLVVALCGSLGGASAVSSVPSIPLSGGTSDGVTTMAIVPMGHLNDPFNTFYESFTQTTSGVWTLSTLPGVGTNGGLSLTSPSQGAVGVLPFDASTASALMRLRNGRASGNGEVIKALAHSPSVIAVDPVTTAISVLLANGTVRTQTLWSNAPVTTVQLSTLKNTSAGNKCGIESLTAIAYETNGDLAVGAQCKKGGTTGVLINHGGVWSVASLPSNGAGSVLRLDVDGVGLLALSQTQGSKASVRALFVGGETTLASPAHSLSGATVRAIAITGTITPTRSDVITLATSKKVVGVLLTPGASSTVTPALPLSTQAVLAAGMLGTTLTAIQVNQGTAIFQTLTPLGTWRTTQSTKISVPYGSAG